MISAHVKEIFNSVQGEGIFNGMRQVFTRFQGCPLNCKYCDTPRSREPSPVCKVERTPCSGDFQDLPNPLEPDQLAELIHQLWSPGTRHLSLTGGEPLVHADFIDALSREVDYPLYLETNGCLPGGAHRIKNMVDVAACDIKLPEHAAAEDYPSLLKAELETVGIFHDAGAVTFAKTVVTDRTTDNALETIASSISHIDGTIPLVLQPVTPVPGFVPPTPLRLFQMLDVVGTYLIDVRAVPQVHKLMDIL